MLFQKINGCHGAAAGGQHGVHHEHLPVGDVIGQLAVVFHRLMGLGVPVQADVADLGGGNQIHHVVHHAQARPQHGDDGQLLARQHPALGGGHRGLHLHLVGGQVPGGLVAHEARDFSDQLPELLDAGILVPEDCQLVLNQGVIQYVNVCHKFRSPFLYILYMETGRACFGQNKSGQLTMMVSPSGTDGGFSWLTVTAPYSGQ